MNKRIVVDPITRIEGHLRIEAEIDEQSAIKAAYSSGTMVRGVEIILKGRDPREAWAFAQRICGVCTLVHGLASVRAVENALHYDIPANANLIRNLMIGAQYVHDHVMHFYHLHALDWVDVVSALKADPAATSTLAQSISGYARSSPGYFADVQKRLKAFVDGGQLGIFAGGYWGHPEYKLPPEANLMAVAHYLDALAWQRDVVKLHAIFGGKNPHPNFLVGGAPTPISAGPIRRRPRRRVTAVNIVTLTAIRDVIAKMRAFVDEVYLPDTLAIAGFYKDWFQRGEGLGNFMTFGDFPADGGGDRSVLAGGRHPRPRPSPYRAGRARRPGAGAGVRRSFLVRLFGRPERRPAPLRRRDDAELFRAEAALRSARVEKSYSWLKAPRWRGKAVEVGPLARVLMLYASGHQPTKDLAAAALKKLDLPLEAMFSTLGRTAARTLETKIIADEMDGWLDALVANIRGRRLDGAQSRQMGAVELAARSQGRRLHGGAARRARPLDRHPRRQDRQLPGGRALDLERRPARSRWASPAPMKPPWPIGIASPCRPSRWKSSAPSTLSTPASPARCT